MLTTWTNPQRPVDLFNATLKGAACTKVRLRGTWSTAQSNDSPLLSIMSVVLARSYKALSMTFCGVWTFTYNCICFCQLWRTFEFTHNSVKSTLFVPCISQQICMYLPRVAHTQSFFRYDSQCRQRRRTVFLSRRPEN